MSDRHARRSHAALRALAFFLLLTPLIATVAKVNAQNSASLDVSPTAEREYRDPGGRFSVPLLPNWTVEEQDGYVLLRSPDGDLNVTVLVIEANDAGAGVIAAWQIVDSAFDPKAKEPDRIDAGSSPGIDQIVVLTYDLGQSTGRVAQGVGLRAGNEVYVLIFRGDLETAVRRQSQINVIASGFQILAVPQVDLTGRAPLSLEGDRLTTFDAFVSSTLAAFGIPGAAVAVVQGDRIVYAKGFGVTEQGNGRPVTPDTLMMIGSVTKSFTTMMMGTIVDDGSLAWDEPVIQSLPTFKVADPSITPKVTVRNLVCACTGVPRRDAEIDFNANELTAEEVIASLANFPFYTPIGEAFQYSNQMVAVGGYIAALAAGGKVGNLHAAYRDELRLRVLEPIGMPRTTFDPAVVAADSDHALPHGMTLNGKFQSMLLASESGEGPVAPAGGLWSSANELTRYVITELRRGVGPGGNRVVSAKNLEETWQPQVAVSAYTSYGLGWYVDKWQGLRVIRHGGNTRGFTSDVAFLPDANLGIIVLTNAQEANVVASGIRQRLLELLYDQPSTIEAELASARDAAEQQRAQVEARLDESIDSALAHTLTGQYTSPALGTVNITYVEGALVADAGEFRVALRPLREFPPEGPVFIVADPPFVGRSVHFDTTGPSPRLIFGAPPEEYVFDRASGHATPAPSPAK